MPPRGVKLFAAPEALEPPMQLNEERARAWEVCVPTFLIGYSSAEAAFIGGQRNAALMSFLSLGNFGKSPQNLSRDLNRRLGIRVTPYHLKIKVVDSGSSSI